MREFKPATIGRFQHVLIRRWRSLDNPLPVRDVERLPPLPQLPRNSSLSGRHDEPNGRAFDFTGAMRRLLDDVVAHTPEFAHIDVNRILVSATSARGSRPHGLQARTTPLRFRGGALRQQRAGILYQTQRFFLDNLEFLYVITFCLPRFLDQSRDEKLVTIFHELHHIDPSFNGDLRRYPGPGRFHATSKRHYDCRMAELARTYWKMNPTAMESSILGQSFDQLRARHGRMTAIFVPRPQMIPIARRQLPTGETMES